MRHLDHPTSNLVWNTYILNYFDVTIASEYLHIRSLRLKQWIIIFFSLMNEQ